MSNHAMTMAWDAADAPTDPGPMWVLIILADHGNDHGGEDFRCYPSVERLMARSKFKRSAVEAHLKTLVMLGWVSRKQRRRPDGKKGVYDYELHREAVMRATLREARAAIVAAGIKVSGEAEDARHPLFLMPPCVNSAHGPCVDAEPAMREIHAEPCVKSEHQEPLEEPKEEPSPGAREADFRREAWRAAFDALVEGAHKRVLKFVDLDEAWAWFQRVVEGGVAAETLVACGAAMAVDPDVKARRFVPPLQDWLSKGQWRGYLAEDGAVAALAEPEPEGPAGAAGPADQALWGQVMAQAAQLHGDRLFGTYLARAWLGERADGDGGRSLVVVAFSGVARDWIKANAWDRIVGDWAAVDRGRRGLGLVTKSEFEALRRQMGEG